MKTPSILIADDQPVVRRGLRALLEAERNWKVVAETSGREAVDKARQLRPDVIIVDISMPQSSGLNVCRTMAESLPNTRILIMTVRHSDDLISKTVKAGARGYVLKSDAERDLVPAVDALLHDRTFFAAAASNVILDRVRGGARRTTESPLSVRETEVLQLVAEGKSNKEAAAILGISTRTAENHRARIMEKLGLRSLSDLVRYAIRNRLIEG